MTGGVDKLMDLLRRAGLAVVGDRRIEEVPPPRAAWRPVVPGGAEPTETVREGTSLPELPTAVMERMLQPVQPPTGAAQAP
ncbi:hypothetical protein SAMN04490357_5860 [Streptomyces misionensis]|uniref:Uncharacterized protein n=1 Tax=Streptomyces misionensis TaxID=67331 RepID=A0A1H5DL30_9ACTN|nr:hypothetical protein [Streptomyces misionensis]SED79544.1 hypothetical protein SAMN04490357_5860 [Streptomyces misionensis]